MKLISTLLSILLFAPTVLFAKMADLKAHKLECENVENPIAIASKQPKLGWQMISGERGKKQTAYRILVAGSLQTLQDNKGDFWDSGKVLSDQSSAVKYNGKELAASNKVYWKVMVWDEKNKQSDWSEAAYWSMGLLVPADWKGKWIGNMEHPFPDSAVTYPAPFFRKEFAVEKKIKQAVAYVAGLGFYELYLNGKKIGDQVLAPAVTNYDRRKLNRLLYPYDDQSTQRVLYNTFDITDDLQQKSNAIGMLLGNGWYNQRDRRVEGDMWYDTPRLIFQLEIEYIDGSKEVVSSDNSWETSTGPLLRDGIFSGENYDARLELGQWQKAGYTGQGWKNAILVRPPSGVLVPQTAPFDKIIRTLVPEYDGKLMDSVHTYHLDEAVSGWASITVKGKAGSRLKIRYISEEGEDYGQWDTYILKGIGTESWEPKFTWHTFRRIEVIAQDLSLDKNSLKIKVVHTDVPFNGSFECSNPFFNKINDAYIKTQNANFHGSISSDCPHRERLGYTGDGQVIVESSIFSYDMRQFYQKWFDDMDDARNKKTGFVTHTAPFGGGGGGPAWGSAYVIMPWTYFSYYGDTSVLTQHYAGMKRWVEYLETRTDKDGLVTREEPDGWCLGDWCTPTNVEVPAPLVNTAYFYHVADIMSKVATVLGKRDDSQAFANLAEGIKVDFNKAYYNASEKKYWEGRQGANVFALALGLVPAENYNAVFNSLLGQLMKINYHFDTGILGTPLLLKVLSQNDRDDIAYQILNQKDFPGFGYLLDDKNSTLWETWNGEGSRCHPMFGSVVEWFYAGIGGIRADTANAGMKHFVIAPKPIADLQYAKSSYNSEYGQIRSEWKRDANGKLEFLVEIPENTTATFMLPGSSQNIKSAAGMNWQPKKVGRKYQFDIQSGIYRFEIL
jgi:alpha-L-rhamnosidase